MLINSFVSLRKLIIHLQLLLIKGSLVVVVYLCYLVFCTQKREEEKVYSHIVMMFHQGFKKKHSNFNFVYVLTF